MRIRTHVFALVSLATFAAGCAAKKGSSSSIDAQDSADSADANASSAQDSHFTQLFASSVTSNDPAAAADGNVPVNQMWPAGCATRKKVDATTVKITLSNCTGPFGLVKVNGDLTAKFSAGANGALHVEVASENLTANTHPVSESGSGDITVSGSIRTVAWQGEWTRLNALGETVAHASDVTIAIDSASLCGSVSGTAKTNVATREIDATISGYKICKLASGEDGCPSGEIAFRRVTTGRTLTVDFDGTAEAKVTGPGGGSIEIPLVCQAT
jgi:hypothetical protein